MYLVKLKEIRLSSLYTQEKLSEKSGVSVRTIQRIESGKAASLDTAKILSRALSLIDHKQLLADVSPVQASEGFMEANNYDYKMIDAVTYDKACETHKDFRLFEYLYSKAFIVVPVTFYFFYFLFVDSQPINEISYQRMIIEFITFFSPLFVWLLFYHFFYVSYVRPKSDKCMSLGLNMSKQESVSRKLLQERFNLSGNVSLHSKYKVDDLPFLASQGDPNALAMLGYMLWEGCFLKKDIEEGFRLLELAVKQGSSWAACYLAFQCKFKRFDAFGSPNDWYAEAGRLGLINTFTLKALNN